MLYRIDMEIKSYFFLKRRTISRTLGTCNLSLFLLRFRARQIFPALVRVGCFLSVAGSFIASSAHPLRLAGAFRLLASLERLVPPSRLRVRSLQWHLLTLWSPESDLLSLPVPLSRAVGGSLFVDSAELSSWRGFFDSGPRLRFCINVRTQLRWVEASASSFVLVSVVY